MRASLGVTCRRGRAHQARGCRAPDSATCTRVHQGSRGAPEKAQGPELDRSRRVSLTVCGDSPQSGRRTLTGRLACTAGASNNMEEQEGPLERHHGTGRPGSSGLSLARLNKPARRKALTLSVRIYSLQRDAANAKLGREKESQVLATVYRISFHIGFGSQALDKSWPLLSYPNRSTGFSRGLLSGDRKGRGTK